MHNMLVGVAERNRSIKGSTRTSSRVLITQRQQSSQRITVTIGWQGKRSHSRSGWGYDFMGDSNIIEVYIRYLTQSKKQTNEKRLIQTVRGVMITAGLTLKLATSSTVKRPIELSDITAY